MAAAWPDYTGHFSHSLLEPVKAYVPRLPPDQIRIQLCDGAADGNTKTLVVWGWTDSWCSTMCDSNLPNRLQSNVLDRGRKEGALRA